MRDARTVTRGKNGLPTMSEIRCKYTVTKESEKWKKENEMGDGEGEEEEDETEVKNRRILRESEESNSLTRSLVHFAHMGIQCCYFML